MQERNWNQRGSKHKEFVDIPYIDSSNHPKHHLDIYAPKDDQINNGSDPGTTGHKKKYPVVFFVHGGGWKRGDRKYKTILHPHLHKNVGEALADHGFVTVVVSYRLAALTKRMATLAALLVSLLVSVLVLSLLYLIENFVTDLGVFWNLINNFPVVFLGLFCVVFFLFLRSREGHPKNTHPVQVMDAAHAFKWVVNNISKYEGDPNNIVIMGHSAGAHIVSLLCFDERYLASVQEKPERTRPVKELRKHIGALIGISGVYNLERLKQTTFAEYFYVRPLLGNVDKRTMEQASPVTHAKKTHYPIFLIHGKNGEFHLPKDAEELEQKLKSLGADVEKRAVPGTHVTIISQMGKRRDVVTAILAQWIHQKLPPHKHKKEDIKRTHLM